MNNKDEAYAVLSERLPLYIPRRLLAEFLVQLPSEDVKRMDESTLEHMFWQWFTSKQKELGV